MVVCNDWHSALVPMLIHAEKPTGSQTGALESVYTKPPRVKHALHLETQSRNPEPKTLTWLQK